MRPRAEEEQEGESSIVTETRTRSADINSETLYSLSSSTHSINDPNNLQIPHRKRSRVSKESEESDSGGVMRPESILPNSGGHDNYSMKYESGLDSKEPLPKEKKTEITRILIQALRELNYPNAANQLETESGCALSDSRVETFRDAVLDGEWEKTELLVSDLIQNRSDHISVSSKRLHHLLM